MAPAHRRRGVDRRRALRTLAGSAVGIWVTNLGTLAREQAMQIHLAAAAQSGGSWVPRVLSAGQLETVGVLVELIIPTTDTPGARDALVDRFVDGVLAAGASADRDRFLTGLAWLDARSVALFDRPFASATLPQQTELLTRLAAADAPAREPQAGVDFFNAIKTLTISGYYTTEIGLRQELGDDGRLMLATFTGCTHPEHQ